MRTGGRLMSNRIEGALPSSVVSVYHPIVYLLLSKGRARAQIRAATGSIICLFSFSFLFILISSTLLRHCQYKGAMRPRLAESLMYLQH